MKEYTKNFSLIVLTNNGKCAIMTTETKQHRIVKERKIFMKKKIREVCYLVFSHHVSDKLLR